MLHSEVTLDRQKTILQLQKMLNHYQAEWGVIYDRMMNSRDVSSIQGCCLGLALVNRQVRRLKLLVGAEMAISACDDDIAAPA
ncbi:MAG: hypothetical protein ACFB0C_19735 [Leptolyngbyaceae cyanobacterium]